MKRITVFDLFIVTYLSLILKKSLYMKWFSNKKCNVLSQSKKNQRARFPISRIFLHLKFFCGILPPGNSWSPQNLLSRNLPLSKFAAWNFSHWEFLPTLFPIAFRDFNPPAVSYSLHSLGALHSSFSLCSHSPRGRGSFGWKVYPVPAEFSGKTPKRGYTESGI